LYIFSFVEEWPGRDTISVFLVFLVFAFFVLLALVLAFGAAAQFGIDHLPPPGPQPYHLLRCG
jgi:hypothetical protein